MTVRVGQVVLEILQANVEVATVADITCTLPESSRGTQLNLNVSDANATKTKWQFIMNGVRFFINTTNAGADSATALDADIDFVNIWFPPDRAFTVRARQKVSGTWGAWTDRVACTSRGYMNSYETGITLSANTITF